MKKLNKKTVNKLKKLMSRAYPVSKNEITNEHWALEKKELKEKIIVILY